jgi:hypothetical protein
MRKPILTILLICFAALSNAMVFTTIKGKTITGKIITNESLRFEIKTDKGSVFLDKDKVVSIIDDNGADVTDTFFKVIPKPVPKADIIHKSMQDALVKKDINEMTDREFAIYLNERQTKSITRTTNTIWYVCGVDLVITVIGGFIFFNNTQRHPIQHGL